MCVENRSTQYLGCSRLFRKAFVKLSLSCTSIRYIYGKSHIGIQQQNQGRYILEGYTIGRGPSILLSFLAPTLLPLQTTAEKRSPRPRYALYGDFHKKINVGALCTLCNCVMSTRKIIGVCTTVVTLKTF